jgi:hypothetical protein
MQHWAQFPAWRPLAKQAKKADFNYKNFAQRENIFMRWKEYFLVPDHRVRAISGASFEGFYYICFNQVAGTVSGIYFHAKSERYVFWRFGTEREIYFSVAAGFFYSSVEGGGHAYIEPFLSLRTTCTVDDLTDEIRIGSSNSNSRTFLTAAVTAPWSSDETDGP